MISNVYIIRAKDSMFKFFAIDPETGNWNWVNNLEDATVFQNSNVAESTRMQKTPTDTYVYEIPFSIAKPQERKKKSSKPKSKITKKTKRRK